MNCPYCNADYDACDSLPDKQEENRFVKCGNKECRKVFGIHWIIVHNATKIEDMGGLTGEDAADIADVAANW